MGEIIDANKKLNFMPSEVNNFYSRNTDTEMNIDESSNFNIEAVEHSFVIKDEIKSFEYDMDCCHADSVTALVPKLKKLQLSSETKGDDSKLLAGYIKAIIPPTGTVVIQLASEDKILDIGTTIFGEKKNGQVKHTEEYQEIGFITDIFGPVHEPMYALQLKEKAIGDSLKINSKVFYFCDHPTTRYISVEHEVENKYTVIQGRRS